MVANTKLIKYKSLLLKGYNIIIPPIIDKTRLNSESIKHNETIHKNHL